MSAIATENKVLSSLNEEELCIGKGARFECDCQQREQRTYSSLSEETKAIQTMGKWTRIALWISVLMTDVYSPAPFFSFPIILYVL